MRIPFEPRNTSGHPSFRLAGRARLATCTAVRLIAPGRLICASSMGQCLYLMGYELAGARYCVLHHLDTRFAEGVDVDYAPR